MSLLFRGLVSLERFFEIDDDLLSEVFDEVEQKVEAVRVYLFEVGFEFTLIALFQFPLHESHLLQSSAGQITQTV